MKKTVICTALTAVLGVTAYSAQSASVNNGDALGITAGVPALDAYGVQTNVSSGSFFGMDNDGNSKITGGEKVALAQGSTGLVIGTTTTAGASHAGPPTAGDTNAITAPWAFFGATGSDYVTTGVTGSTTSGLNMSGWTVTWNAIPAIPMGSGAWQPGNCVQLGCSGTFTNGNAHFAWDGTNGGGYSLDYTGRVPANDPSGFGGVGYYLHLEGTVTTGTPPAVPVPAAVWLFGSGLMGLVGVARRKKA